MLRGVDPLTAVRTGEAAAEALCGSSAWGRASAILLYSALPGEVSTAPLRVRAHAEGKSVWLPRMIDGARLEFLRVTPDEPLRRGPFGVEEPAPRPNNEALAGDALAIVPGLAFDLFGGRLGRGRGYYDRALRAVREEATGSYFVGLAFALQIVSRVPMSPHDVGMDGLLTEQGFTERTPST